VTGASRGVRGKAEADVVANEIRHRAGARQIAQLVGRAVGAGLDVLAANTGVSKLASIDDTLVEDFDHLFAVNLRAPFFHSGKWKTSNVRWRVDIARVPSGRSARPEGLRQHPMGRLRGSEIPRVRYGRRSKDFDEICE
jgi:NAD(P)-dependent dehydrogenase (short-subunit alcohol dehydrogenase family)